MYILNECASSFCTFLCLCVCVYYNIAWYISGYRRISHQSLPKKDNVLSCWKTQEPSITRNRTWIENMAL